MTEFYYLLMENLEFLKANVIEEVLRERAAYYLSKKKKKDFWIIESPQFIYEKGTYREFQNTVFYRKNKKKKYFAILSSDQNFVNWLALRIGYFEPFTILNINDKKNLLQLTINGILGLNKSLNPLISFQM